MTARDNLVVEVVETLAGAGRAVTPTAAGRLLNDARRRVAPHRRGIDLRGETEARILVRILDDHGVPDPEADTE